MVHALNVQYQGSCRGVALVAWDGGLGRVMARNNLLGSCNVRGMCQTSMADEFMTSFIDPVSNIDLQYFETSKKMVTKHAEKPEKPEKLFFCEVILVVGEPPEMFLAPSSKCKYFWRCQHRPMLQSYTY